MATLGDVLANILTIVPQPDKETLIRSRINYMINYISKAGLFWRDIEETTIGATEGVDAASLTQSIPITTAQRKFIYVKSKNADEKPITIIDVLMLNKAECARMLPIAYIAGSTLYIKHEELTTEFDIAYYTSPTSFALNGDDDAETNWILTLVPELVEDLTSAYLLNLIGDTEDSKRITELAGLLRGTYIHDFVTAHIDS